MIGIDPEAVIDFDHNSLSIYFPLPFRILFLFILGFWLWGTNLHYLSMVRVDVGPMIRYIRHTPPEPPLHQSVYEVAMVLSVVWGVGLLVFWKVSHGVWEEAERWGGVPFGTAMVCLGCVVLPVNVWHRKGRGRFMRMLRRVSIGGLDTDLRFADILLADVLTSYAKVFGDTWILLCMSLFTGRQATTSLPDRSCGGGFAVPFIMALPYLIRLRQCLTEYFRVSGKVSRKEANVHLWNAGKYSSAFPVILMSALQRGWDPEQNHVINIIGMETIWLFFVFFNSLFSFYWDVTKDWDLTLLSLSRRERSNPEYPYGLRQTRQFHAPELYYGVVALDFMLRCTWSFKLSPHLGYLNDLEGGIFVLELLEVLRRWMWMFLRIEKEWCSRGLGVGPGGEGLVLGEWTKVDED